MIENLNKITTMIDIFGIDETILINSDIDIWSKNFGDDMQVHFVNTNQKVIKSIDDISLSSKNWTQYSDMINSSSNVSRYNTYSNPSLDGQVDSSIVSHLWTNIKKLNSKDIDTISFESFISSNCKLDSTKMLVIDSLDGMDILADTDIKVLGVDIVSIRLINTDDQRLLALSKSIFDTKMLSLGYKVISCKPEYHPDIYIVVYIYNYKSRSIDSSKSLKELTSQNSNFTSKIKELEDGISKERSAKESKEQEVSKLKNELETKTKELQQNLEQEKQTLEKVEQEKETVLKEKETTKKENESQKSELQKQIQEQLLLEQKVKALEEQELKLETILEKQEANFKKYNIDKPYFDTLKKEIIDKVRYFSANSSKQIEAFMSLENYLLSGKQPLNFHGWPISPDIALFLIEKIELNNYDLVMEFGSGTSTILFANALKNKRKKSKNSKKIRQVSFDHNEKYYNQTRKSLKSNKLLKGVELIHAPLEECKLNEEMFMYYSCREKFQELKDDESIQSILVLVDGPPGATGPLARFPALSYLLEAFKGKRIHLVLDDYNREEEKNIAKKWEQSLEKMSMSFISESIPSEKGLYFCQIN